VSDDFAQFQEAFFEEAAEHLAIVEEGLLALEQHPDDLDLLGKIFRSAHSIKGTSGMFGFNAVAQFTHKMETLLDLLRRINVERHVTIVTATHDPIVMRYARRRIQLKDGRIVADELVE